MVNHRGAYQQAKGRFHIVQSIKEDRALFKLTGTPLQQSFAHTTESFPGQILHIKSRKQLFGKVSP